MGTLLFLQHTAQAVERAAAKKANWIMKVYMEGENMNEVGRQQALENVFRGD